MLKKKVSNVSFGFWANNIVVNTVKKYILGNASLKQFIISFLFAITVFSCIVQIISMEIKDICSYLLDYNFEPFNLSDLPFFWASAFGCFVTFYIKQYNEIVKSILTLLILCVVLLLRTICFITPSYCSELILIVLMLISVLMILKYDNTQKEDDIRNV